MIHLDEKLLKEILYLQEDIFKILEAHQKMNNWTEQNAFLNFILICSKFLSTFLVRMSNGDAEKIEFFFHLFKKTMYSFIQEEKNERC